jgi:hypothetical protein
VNRTSIVLGIIALLLAGYVVFVERGSLSTGELEKRKGSALPELVRERVERLEIQRKGVTTVLARTLRTDAADDEEASEEDEAALWRVEAPYKAKADQGSIDTLLGELEWLDGRRKLGPVSAEDKQRFGFDKPRVRVVFTVGKVRVTLAIGKDSPRGDGVYVMAGSSNAGGFAAGEPPQAFLAGKDLIEAFSHEPGHYHHRELHDGMLVSTARALTLRDQSGERGAKKRDDGLWAMSSGADGLSSEQAVTELVDALDGLRTQRFVADHVKDLARYGLAQPRFRFELHKTKLLEAKKPAGGKELALARETTSFVLRVGSACAGHAGESYISVDGVADVSCASDVDLAKLDKNRDQLREVRLLPLAEQQVKALSLQLRGVRLTLSADDEGAWSYAVQGGGVPKLAGKARDGAVSDWLKALSAASVTRFDVPPPAELAQPSAFALEVGRGKDKPPFVLKAVLSGMDLLARRADEPQAVAFAADTAALLAPQAARFRPLTVLSQPEPALRAIEVERGAVHERMTRAQGATAWSLVAPAPLAADSVIAAELSRSLSALEAVRFEADLPEPGHGLAAPAAVVTLEHAPAGKPAVRTVIELGAETEGGRFAQLRGQPGVFVLAARTAKQLLEPLVSRTLLATPLERLRDATLDRAGKRVQAGREAVATLRAMRVLEYGAPGTETGLQHAEAKLEILADDGSGKEQRYTLLLGADAGDGARYARRSDVPLTFVLPKEQVDKLLSAP